MIKIGVIGVGHLGSIHLKCIQMVEQLELVGCFDIDEEKNQATATAQQIKAFSSAEELIEAVDIVDIVTPTINHFELAREAISKGRHVFIEKPLTHTIEEGRRLLMLSQQMGVKVQVGHVERFNPAFLALSDHKLSPMFIEAHRLAAFNPRGTDVSVILDLMIHDIDIVLSMVQSPVKSISASGVAVVSETPDISNARLEFENGCVANLTASRISLKQMRKLRLFQKDAYISLDFLEKQAQIVRLYDKAGTELPPTDQFFELETGQGTKLIHVEMPEITEINAIKMELESLATSIENDTAPAVDISDGLRALEVAHQIIKEIAHRQEMAMKNEK